MLLTFAHHRGILTGKSYARSLLRPGNVMAKPRCPYWCVTKAFAWHLGFSLGCYEVINDIGSR